MCVPILGIYNSLTDTRMWKLGMRLRNSQKKIHKWVFCCSAHKAECTMYMLEEAKDHFKHCKNKSEYPKQFWKALLMKK
jgi:hypothetical protein